MRTIFIINSLFLIFTLLQGSAKPGYPEIHSDTKAARPEEVETSPSFDGMTISLKAATEATILFKADNGQQVDAPQEEDRKIPYLVLNRNGVSTPNFERTLHISLDNLQVPASGLYASLEIETQHSDPDLGREATDKIRIWEEKRFIPPSRAHRHHNRSILRSSAHGLLSIKRRRVLPSRLLEYQAGIHIWKFCEWRGCHPIPGKCSLCASGRQ